MTLLIKGNWNQLKGQLKQLYGELNDEDLKIAEGKAEELLSILHEKTGRSMEELEEVLTELESKHI